MKYELQVIPPSTVSENPSDYNTSFHSASELPVRDDEKQSHLKVNIAMTNFGHHRHLVLSSRQINPNDVYTGTLTPKMIKDIQGMSNFATLTGRIPKEDLDDLLRLFAQHAIFPPTIPTKGWFVRLDEVSPKDSLVSSGPIRTPTELVYVLATSRRVLAAFTRTPLGANLYFIPWDPTINSKREFRVFCPPTPDITGLKFTCITQYAWHSPFPFLASETPEWVAQKVLEGSRQVLEDIKWSSGYNIELQNQGFSFDVRLRDSGVMELIDLNTFGALTGCGSGLFHWIRDFNQLYFGPHSVIRMSY
jgi:hypothetical protein